MSRIVLDLPLAPTVNQLWEMNRRPGGKDRRPSRIYRDWRWEAFFELSQIKPKPRVEGKYRAFLFWPEKDRADVDNRTKATLDFLAAHGVTDDDRNCVKSSEEKSPDVKPGRMRVEIEPWPA